MGSAITLLEENHRENAFIGHPGLPFVAFIQIIIRVNYWVAKLFGTSVSYASFVAKNLQWIIFLSKLSTTGLHILSFWVQYKVVRYLTNRSDISILAVIAYSTTYPVLVYLNNISPEPMLVIFVFLAIFWLWEGKRSLVEGASYKSYLLIALSGFASVAAIYTKFMISAPLLIFSLAYLLFKNNEDRLMSSKRRWSALSVYMSSFVIIFAIGTYLVNWGRHLRFWFDFVPGASGYQSDLSLSNTIFEILIQTINHLVEGIKTYSPGITINGLFTIAEFAFLVIAVIGFVSFFRDRPDKRDQLIWMGIFTVLMTPMAIFRHQWHYLFLHLVLASVFFSYQIIRVCENRYKGTDKAHQVLKMATLATLVIHGVSFILFVDAKKFDIEQYAHRKLYFEALNEITYNGHIGIQGDVIHTEDYSSLLRYTTNPGNFREVFGNFFLDISEFENEVEMGNAGIETVLENGPEGLVKNVISK